MPFSIDIPDSYGYVILTCGVGPVISSAVLSHWVMTAREEMSVKYPNLYATPGYHKQADEFNRLQRGHQSMFEFVGSFTPLALVGGLKHPLTCAVSGVLFSLGYILFGWGYADAKLGVAHARYMKGGGIKWLGYFGVVGTSVSIAGSMVGWWK